MKKISAVIITYNEEKNIQRCLESLKGVVDEIVVVDSLSTDNTKKICEKFDVHFIENPFEGHIEQKNYAMGCARNDYVLSLDADEALSPKLKESILKVKENWTADFYSFNRLNNYCGQWIRHSGWYPDKKIRLWDRRKGKWGGKNPHDNVVMK
ncbi:glycosyltransferase family 2 protein, partial [Cytophagales bacterium RKSG123]|nr:glycosyltransferase family 2 protein [Xanthovirga aplysinae]